MPFCTGQGYPDEPGGCCHLGDGRVCPHYQSAETVGAWIAASGYKGAAKNRMTSQAQGALHLCDIALRVIADDSRTLADRALFEQRWTGHPDYVRDVRPAWDELEARMGYPPGGYNCATWQGGGSQAAVDWGVPETAVLTCCWGQDDATCDAQAQAMHVTAVAIRRAGRI
jgi:hypothetical protein